MGVKGDKTRFRRSDGLPNKHSNSGVCCGSQASPAHFPGSAGPTVVHIQTPRTQPIIRSLVGDWERTVPFFLSDQDGTRRTRHGAPSQGRFHTRGTCRTSAADACPADPYFPFAAQGEHPGASSAIPAKRRICFLSDGMPRRKSWGTPRCNNWGASNNVVSSRTHIGAKHRRFAGQATMGDLRTCSRVTSVLRLEPVP